MQDLSHLAAGPLARTSMAATNTVSAAPPFTGPGSESESTHALEQYTVDVHPVDKPLSVLEHGGG